MNANRQTSRVVLGAALLAAAWLPSCATRAVPVQSPATVPASFSASGQAPLPGTWWTSLGDAELNALVDQALAGNFSLRSAWDRLDQSRATARRSGADLWPSLTGSGDATRTRVKNDGAQRIYSTDYSLGLVASYEIDLWGRVRSTRDAAALDVYATTEDLHAAAITLTAEVARAWYRLIEQRGQLRLLDDQVTTNEKYLEIITLRFRRGQVSATDVLQQRQLVEKTRGERSVVESSIAVLESQLAVLLGRAPGSLTIADDRPLPQVPALPQTGLPAEWLRRRPDVRAAEIRVQAADRRVAAAIADQFPTLGISVRAETSAERVRDLFDNWLAALAANVVAPIIDGGSRRAEVERTRAVVSERLNSYGQTVLESLKEVEDALAQESRQAEYVASLTKQLDLARQSTDQTLENYTKGSVDFTRYLTTLLSYQILQRTHLQAQRDLVLYRIDLCRSLAGSWALPRPERAAVSGKAVAVEAPADPQARNTVSTTDD